MGSNIIYTRLGGLVCEDPATNRDFCRAYGGGMQSTWNDDMSDDQGWGKDSVAIMLKHYVGGGTVEGGRNDHNDAGKYDVFPGKNFNAHLIPFLDGGLHLDSKTSQMAAVSGIRLHAGFRRAARRLRMCCFPYCFAGYR